MGCRILADHYRHNAVMYCSTSGWAFGPVFDEHNGHDAEERVEAFQRWLEKTDQWATFEREPLSRGHRDARELTEAGLASAYSAWLAQEDEQWAREEAAEFAAEED